MDQFCHKCGEKIQKGNVYCVWCGTKVLQDTSAVEEGNISRNYYSESSKQKISFKRDQIKEIYVNCKVLSINILSDNIEDIQITWDQTSSWGLMAAQEGECLQLNEKNSLGFHNIFDFINSRQNSEIKIELPKSYMGLLKVQTETGSIDIEELDTDVKIEVKTTIGHIIAKNLSVDTFSAIGSIGKIILNHVHSRSIYVENRATAPIDCKGINADDSITITNATSEITCDIDDEASNYTSNCHSNYGYCNLPGITGNGCKKLDININAGSIDVQFKKIKKLIENR